MMRILIVDDHPAMRAGLAAVLNAEPGITVLGAVASASELEPALRRASPNVIVLDYHLPGTDGLRVCRQLKRTVPAPKVLLYSAWADAELVVPAILAGADGLVNKSVPAPELYDALRTISRGDSVLPPLTPELREHAAERVEEADRPILSMVLGGTPPADICDVLDLEAVDYARRIDAMISALRVEVPADAV